MHPLLDTLHTEIVPALGCTEPAAAALAAAKAVSLLPEPMHRLQLRCSNYIAKNAMNVGIPGTDGLVGLPVAAAMGAACGTPELGLEIFRGVNEEQRLLADTMLREGRINIAAVDTPQKIFIEAVATGECHIAKAVISGRHTHFSLLQLDGETLLEASPPPPECGPDAVPMTVESIYDFCLSIPVQELLFLEEVLDINHAIAQEGLEGHYGLSVGKSLLAQKAQSLWGGDLASRAVAWTAAAADARMSGCDKHVMTTAGSGNQGLTASIPIQIVAQGLSSTQEATLRALALSELVTIHTKRYIGRLSALCGCSISAGIGTCCGVIHLLGGTKTQVYAGIRTMVADVSGMICDGAKPGCSLKIATSVSAAMRAASLAMADKGASGQDGIVSSDVEETLQNLGILGEEGMAKANATILDILMDKKQLVV